jgi:PAS domain-containing protein
MSERDPTESTQLVPVLIWHDPRVQLLDDTWLLTICAALLAIALPWLVSGLRIEFAASAAGLLVLGAIHVVLAAMSGVRPTSQRRETLRLSSLHALGVITIAFIWQHAGGLQNPLFLVVFAIPVIAAIFLSRWQPYLMAALVVLTVTLLACSEAPQLRWYAPWLGAPGGWLAGLLGGAGATQQPFAAFYAPSQYFIVLLEVFAIMVFACAVAAEYLATIFERLDAQVSAARAEAARSQELWSTLVEQLPVPAMLLDATSREIVGASGSAVKKFLSDAAPAVGRDFFDAVRFSYPEPIERLIDGADGVEPLSMIQLDGRVLASEVRVQHLAQHGRRFALVVVNDTSEEFCVKAALDAAEYAALVVDAQGRVVVLNRPARALFGGATPGVEVSSLVPHVSAARWWDPGLGGRHKTHMTVMRRMYQVTTSAVPLPGEETRLYVVTFLPMARGAAEDQTAATGSNTVVQWP